MVREYGNRSACVIDRHIHHFGLGDAHSVVWGPGTSRFDGDTDGDRGVTHLCYFGIKTDKVSYENGRDEIDFVQCGGDESLLALALRLDRASLVDVTEDKPTKDRAQRIGI